MIMSILRFAALAALTVGLTSPLFAQNGFNAHVLTNGADVVYLGFGAGGTWIPGDDGVGYWVDGEEMRGNTLTALGDFGYKQAGWTESPCLFGPTGSGGVYDIRFPIIALMEFDGLHAFDQAAGVWNRAACSVASVGPSCFPIGGSGGLPYGPVGASANFLLTDLPSGLSSFAQGFKIVIPNNGLQGATSAGTATLIAFASDISLAASAGCWLVAFNWVPSAVPALDDINGWYHWSTSSPDNNQYYAWSNDEQNLWQSNSIAGGSLGLFAFFGNLELEVMSVASTPVTNYATAPNGFNGTSPYQSMVGQPMAGTGPEYPAIASFGLPAGGLSPNGGFDLGRHSGISLSGRGGAGTGAGGLGAQDPATGGFLNLPTLGFVTWNGGPNTVATGAVGDPRSHVTWVQGWFDGVLAGLSPGQGDPGTNGNPDILVGTGGANRFPLTMQESLGFAFPAADVAFFGPVFLTPVQDQSGSWVGVPGASSIVGSSVHLPLGGGALSASAFGLPVGVQAGTSQLANFMAPPLLWNKNPANPQQDAVGTSVIIPLID
ncbi:MAG: hypothetical protein DRQ55_08485 [Planctomycetota bacterium]|nr:MAG: hypothetical protein DRQ55_08485 [Planctomycetota bacterium]